MRAKSFLQFSAHLSGDDDHHDHDYHDDEDHDHHGHDDGLDDDFANDDDSWKSKIIPPILSTDLRLCW